MQVKRGQKHFPNLRIELAGYTIDFIRMLYKIKTRKTRLYVLNVGIY